MPFTDHETAPPAQSSVGPDRVRRWAPAFCITLLSAVYFVPTCFRAATEKLWFDEIFTFDASGLLPSVGALWTALKQVDYSPPLGYILAAGSQSVFGRNEFGLRFPSILAFWIMALCLYVFLRRRFPWSYSLAGVLLTALSAAGRYSYEARPPALVLALGAIALVAWQAATEGRSRRLALVTLSLALMAALFSHAMAVTLALPFIAGELVRTYQRRRVDWAVLGAFAASTPALLVLWVLKKTGDATAYWRFNGTVHGHILTTYLRIVSPAVVPLGMALLVTLVLRTQGAGTEKRASGMRAHELGALVGFALIPFAAVPISTLGGHYFLRYSLNCIVGLAGLLVALLFRIGGTNRLTGATVLAIFGAYFAAGQFYPRINRPDGGLKETNSSEQIQTLADHIPPDVPLVICQGTTFVELEHYASPQLASRLYYLTEPAVAAAIDGDILFEVKEPLIARYFPFRAHFEDYHAFIATHPRFYVIRPIRNIAREYFAGRLDMRIRETADHLQYFEAHTTVPHAPNPPIGVVSPPR